MRLRCSRLADSASAGGLAFGLSDGSLAVQILRDGDDEGVGVTLVANKHAGYGVVVTAVVPGRAAHRAGIQVGHVILSIDGQLSTDHRVCTSYMDATPGTLVFVVAKRKLNADNVTRQHVGQVPCEVIVEGRRTSFRW